MANRKKLELDSLLEFPKAHTKNSQICKNGAQPQLDSVETRLPSGQCTPELPPRSPIQTIAEKMVAFTDEPVDTGVAAKAACMLSAAKVMTTQGTKGTSFKRKSWADLSEETEDTDEPLVMSWSTTPDMQSWASTPALSPRAHSPSVAPVGGPKQDEMAPASAVRTSNATESSGASSDLGTSDSDVMALIRGLNSPESHEASSDFGSSDTAVSALIRGLREAAMFD
jgi:hypothetical protein